MIIDAIVTVIRTVLEGILGLLPAVSLPTSLVTNFGNIGETASAMNGVLPVAALGSCLIAVLGVKVLLLVWGVVVWIYEQFPFKAT